MSSVFVLQIMSLIQPIKLVPQPVRSRGVNDDEARHNEQLSKRDIHYIVGTASGSLLALFLIAWLLLPHSSNIVPFVVVSALPLFTLIAIVYQAVVYRRQWNAMRDSLKQTDKVIGKMQAQLSEIQKQSGIMDNSLVETRNLVKHTERGIEVAEQNAQYAQRAYVTVSKRKIVDDGFYLTIENSGNTPALDVAVNVITSVGFEPRELPKEVTLKGYTHIGLLAPHTSYEMLVPFEGSVSENEREYFDDPESQFDWWCTGTIGYRDIFQSDREYNETRFCFYQDRPRMKVQAWVMGNDMKVNRRNPSYPEKIQDPN